MAGTNIAVTTEAFNKASDKSWLGTRAGLKDMRSITIDISTFDAQHIVNGYLPSGIVLGKITATGKYGPYEGGQGSVNEVQSIAVDATGGTFKATFDGVTTGALAFNISAANLKEALAALPGLEAGDLTVAGGPGSAGAGTPYTVTFGGQYADEDVPALTTDPALLTGGAGTAVVSTTTAGGGAGPVSDGREVPAGHLFEEVKVVALTDADCGAALFWTGVVKKSKLPTFASTGVGRGSVDANCERVLAGWIRYEA